MSFVTLKMPTFKPSGTYLYNEGDECEAITGGWSKGLTGGATFTKYPTYMELTRNYGQGETLISNNTPIDFSGYTTINISISVTNKTSVYSSNSRSSGFTNVGVFYTDETQHTISLPTSAFGANGYISFSATHDSLTTSSWKIYKIWLE